MIAIKIQIIPSLSTQAIKVNIYTHLILSPSSFLSHISISSCKWCFSVRMENFFLVISSKFLWITSHPFIFCIGLCARNSLRKTWSSLYVNLTLVDLQSPELPRQLISIIFSSIFRKKTIQKVRLHFFNTSMKKEWICHLQ